MGKEAKRRIPCLRNTEVECDCPWLPENAASINEMGNRDRVIRSGLQRAGYDRVSPQLIVELLVNPRGSFYTEAFDEQFPFGREAWGVREYIMRERFLLLWRLEHLYEVDEIQCPVWREEMAKK
jgi:Uma2 family endonuclease